MLTEPAYIVEPPKKDHLNLNGHTGEALLCLYHFARGQQ